MTFRAIRVALLLSTLPAAGCGTVTNLVGSHPGGGGKVPFGGVRQDVACIHKATNEEHGFTTEPESDSEKYRQVAHVLLYAADLPLTLIGDVVTWPYVVAYNVINQPTPVPPVTQAPADGPPQPYALMPQQQPAPAPPPTQLPAGGIPQVPPSELLPKPTKLP